MARTKHHPSSYPHIATRDMLAPKLRRNTAMHLAMLTTFAASKKEPLADVLERIHAAIVAADLGEPLVQFVLADSRGVSSVDRVLKRFPSLERFVQSLQPTPGVEAVKAISNRVSPGTSAETIDFAILLEIARGVPRSFPFHSIGIQFSVPAFSDGATPKERRFLRCWSVRCRCPASRWATGGG